MKLSAMTLNITTTITTELSIMILSLTTIYTTLSTTISIAALNILTLSKTATMQHPAAYFSDMKT
jgi:hypothetical protein